MESLVESFHKIRPYIGFYNFYACTVHSSLQKETSG